MSMVDPMIERFARAKCVADGQDPDTMVVDFPPIPWKVKDRQVAFASSMPEPYPMWRIYWTEGYLMAKVYWEEQAEACLST
jgi:hypothetical protein